MLRLTTTSRAPGAIAVSLLLLLSAVTDAQADACFDAVQDKIAWDRAGHTRWMPGNIAKLCAGAEGSVAPAQCFAEAMRSDPKRQWPEAIAMCAGKRDASAQATRNEKPGPTTTSLPSPPVVRWAAEIKAQANQAHTDLSALGIELAAPLALPTCASVTPAKPPVEEPTSFNQLLDPEYLARRGATMEPTRKCIIGDLADTTDGWAVQLAGIAGVRLIRDVPGGTQRLYIHFTPSDRPSWFFGGVIGVGGTQVSVLMVDGHVGAVEITRLNNERATDIMEAIQAKFIGIKGAAEPYECANAYERFTMNRAVWSMGHLTVTYDPGCDLHGGALFFDTSIIGQVHERARRARAAADPKL